MLRLYLSTNEYVLRIYESRKIRNHQLQAFLESWSAPICCSAMAKTGRAMIEILNYSFVMRRRHLLRRHFHLAMTVTLIFQVLRLLSFWSLNASQSCVHMKEFKVSKRSIVFLCFSPRRLDVLEVTLAGSGDAIASVLFQVVVFLKDGSVTCSGGLGVVTPWGRNVRWVQEADQQAGTSDPVFPTFRNVFLPMFSHFFHGL